MSRLPAITRVIQVLFLPTLAGCGFVVPEMQSFYKANYHQEGIDESNLVGNIKCQLHYAIQDVFDEDENSKNQRLSYPLASTWLKDWGAQVNLKIAVDEKSNVSPGAILTTPMQNVVTTFPSGGPVTSPQSFGMGLGGALSGDATRTETIGFYYLFSDLQKEGRITKESCAEENGLLIDSDLKIDQFMENKVLIAENPHLLSNLPGAKPKNPGSPFNTFTYEVSFIVVGGLSATPMWKLVRVSANTTGTFLGASRMRTDDLTITMGKATINPVTKKPQPSDEARDQHLAALIGQAVATAIQSQQH